MENVVFPSEEGFRIAKGRVFQKEYEARSQEVVSLPADTVMLRQTVEELARPGEGAVSGEVPPESVSPDHVSQVLRAPTSPHDLAEEEDALRREAIRTGSADEPEPTNP